MWLHFIRACNPQSCSLHPISGHIRFQTQISHHSSPSSARGPLLVLHHLCALLFRGGQGASKRSARNCCISCITNDSLNVSLIPQLPTKKCNINGGDYSICSPLINMNKCWINLLIYYKLVEINNLSKSGLWVKIHPFVAEIFEFFCHNPQKKTSSLNRENPHIFIQIKGSSEATNKT